MLHEIGDFDLRPAFPAAFLVVGGGHLERDGAVAFVDPEPDSVDDVGEVGKSVRHGGCRWTAFVKGVVE